MPIAPDTIARAAAYLREGKLVSFPTETVYGLGGNALSDAAVAAIFAVKGRPSFNPLIIHVADAALIEPYALIGARAGTLMERFWPGPLTLVLPRREGRGVSLLACAGLDTVAVRIPSHPVARALLAECRLPIAAPSANKSGRISPTLAEHVSAELGDDIAMILDGGPCAIGIESTVLDLSGETPVLLRPGSITKEELEAALGMDITLPSGSAILSPGMLASHYAPRLELRLNATQVAPGEALLAFGAPLEGAAEMRNLSETENLCEAAANLFAHLRALDKSGEFTGIAAMAIPEEGLGIAINDRLKRAAAPR